MKKNYLLFVLFAMILSDLGYSQTICSYNVRKRITFDPSKVSGGADLVNFPALINITTDNDIRTTANGGGVIDAQGDDIVFTSDDGVTLLEFEREDYDGTNGHYTAWVKIPLLSTTLNTSIYMYYGGTVTTNQSAATVWSGYHGVWHLQNSNFADSSPNTYAGTNNGTTTQATAIINEGRANNGTQWIEVSSSFPDITTNFSISGWVRTSLNTKQGQRIFCDDRNNSGGYALSIGDAAAGSLRFFSRGSSNVILDTPNNTIASNTWYYCVGVADITNGVKSIYVNGALAATGNFTGWGTDAGNSSMAGEVAAGETGNRLQGDIDEVRVANTALSADWIATEYNNQSSPSTFYSISAEPRIWDGSSSQAWNTNQNWFANTKPGSGDDVIIATVASQPTLNVSPQIGSLWIQPSMVLNISTRSLQVYYDITNCGTINGSTGTLVLNGTSTSIQNQNLSGSGTFAPNNLVINNVFATSPSVTLNSPVTVSGSLELSSGVVVTSLSNILTLGTAAGSSPGSSGSYVSGPISKLGGTQSFVFPTGKGGRWRRVGVSGLSGTASFRAEYFNSVPSNTGNVNAPLTDVSVLEYWQLDRIAGAGNARVSLYWEDATLSGITTCSDLTIARNNGASWDERAATTVAGSSCSGAGTGTVTTTAVITAFSPFTFGSKQPGAINPLPITLLDFQANCNKNEIDLEWHTASEKNNAYFILQKSVNGYDWNEIDRTKGAGTTETGRSYAFSDNQNINGQNYYRLAQVDFNGGQSSWWTIETNCLAADDQMKIYPNPSAGEVNIEFSTTTDFAWGTLEITDATGRLCYSEPFTVPGKRATYTLPLKLEPGVYFVKFRSDTVSLTVQKLLIDDY
jgi:hypothetical protein